MDIKGQLDEGLVENYSPPSSKIFEYSRRCEDRTRVYERLYDDDVKDYERPYNNTTRLKFSLQGKRPLSAEALRVCFWDAKFSEPEWSNGSFHSYNPVSDWQDKVKFISENMMPVVMDITAHGLANLFKSESPDSLFLIDMSRESASTYTLTDKDFEKITEIIREVRDDFLSKESEVKQEFIDKMEDLMLRTVTTYKSDFYDYDSPRIRQMKSSEEFLWMMRDSGTHFVRRETQNPNDYLCFSGAMQSWSDRIIYQGRVNGAIREISEERAVALLGKYKLDYEKYKETGKWPGNSASR